MKHITLQIPERDYEIVSKCACAEGISIEQLAWEAVKSYCSCALQEHLGCLAGFGFRGHYDDIWSPIDDEVFEETSEGAP